MARSKTSPASSITDESCFADVSAKGSPCSISIAPASPLNVRSHDPNLRIESTQKSGGTGASSGPKFPGTCHVGGENVSPNQNFASDEVKSSNFNEDSTNTSSLSVCTTVKKHYPTLGDRKDEIDFGAAPYQIHFQPKTVRFSITSLGSGGQTYSATEVNERSLHHNSEDDSSTLQSSAEQDSPKRESSPLKDESPSEIKSTAPQSFKTIVKSICAGKLRGPQQLTPNEMRQDLGSQFEPSPEEIRRQTASRRHKAEPEVLSLEPVIDPSPGVLCSLGPPKQPGSVGHRKASSGLSSIFLGVINSVASAGSSSSVNSSHQKPQVSRPRLSRFLNRSSTLSDSQNQISGESECGIDLTSQKAADDRGQQRRQILEELIDSETSYIFDLKILAHVYLSLLGSTQVLDKIQLEKTQECVTDMIRLHEQILGEVKRIRKVFSQRPINEKTSPRMTKHVRFESIESLRSVSRWRKNPKRYDWSAEIIRTSKMANPKEAADVAKLFSDMIGGRVNLQIANHFSIYEEYGVMYAEVLRTSTSISRNLLDWDVFERGIEGLVHHVLESRDPLTRDKKGLTLEDLLIKPLQRICRYPLLFAELQSQCPAVDDPYAHTTITRTLESLREVANDVNNATNDLEAQARRRRSEQLNELIKFPTFCMAPVSLATNVGHARLCGVLFVAYQTNYLDFKGSFMLCALFNTCMLLATPDPGFKHFTIQVILALDTVKINATNNGNGLQCKDTPCAWKMMFHTKGRPYEILLCAGSDLEQQRWKSELESISTKEHNYVDKTAHIPQLEQVLLEDIEPFAHKTRNSVESYFGHEHLVRRSSKSFKGTRTAIVNIRNTHVSSKGDPSENQCNLYSSQDRSHAMGSNIVDTIIADKNQRIRMEQAMSNVWTRDTLPYPVMTASRSEQLFRASASLMRKLSKASITSSASKRSASQRSHASTVDVCRVVSLEDPFVERPKTRQAVGLGERNAMQPILQYEPTIAVSRRVSFSDALSRPKRQLAKDQSSSDAETVIGVKSTLDANDKPKKSNSLLKVLSKEKPKSWMP